MEIERRSGFLTFDSPFYLARARKSLFLSIWGIAIGIILWISGALVGGMGVIYHPGGWFTSGSYELTNSFYVGVGLAWSGIILLILGVFGVITTFIREYLDREHKPIQSPPSPPQLS